MTARTPGILVTLASVAAAIACSGAPASPTLGLPSQMSSALSSTLVVGNATQEFSAEAFDLLAVQDLTAATGVRSIDATKPCRFGGTRGISGTITRSASGGTRTWAMDLDLTFTNCDVGRVTLQGNPGITLTGQRTVQNGVLTSATFQKTGGLFFTPEGGVKGSVQVNCTATWNPQSGSFSTSGTVSWEYPAGTPVPGPGCGETGWPAS